MPNQDVINKANEIKQKYPQLYDRIQPEIRKRISGYPQDLSEDDLNSLANAIAASTSTYGGEPAYGYSVSGRDPSLSDIIKFLILADLYNNAGDSYYPYPVYPYPYPYYGSYLPFLPFIPFRSGHRGHDGRHMGHGGGHMGHGGGHMGHGGGHMGHGGGHMGHGRR